MSQYIGDIPVAAIEGVEIASGKPSEDIDLITEGERLVFEKARTADKITINVALLEGDHPEELKVEDQRKDLKDLASNDAKENSFTYMNFEGAIAIDEVNVPESSSMPTYRQGTISGIYLPWPKHFPNTKPNHGKLMKGVADLNLGVDAIPSMGVISNGTVDYSLSLTADGEVIRGMTGDVSLSMDITGDVDVIRGMTGDVQPSLDVQGDAEHANGPFGATFGRSFGGT